MTFPLVPPRLVFAKASPRFREIQKLSSVPRLFAGGFEIKFAPTTSARAHMNLRSAAWLRRFQKNFVEPLRCNNKSKINAVLFCNRQHGTRAIQLWSQEAGVTSAHAMIYYADDQSAACAVFARDDAERE